MHLQLILKKIQKEIGPIVLSVLSLFISFNIIQPFACLLDPTFNLLSSRGIGKIAISVMVILQIVLLLACLSQKLFDKFLRTVFFFNEKAWTSKLALYFALFFSAHMLFQISFFFLGYIHYNPNWGSLNITLLSKIALGFLVTFFLAWTEEAIFRGMVYTYFNQFWNKIPSMLVTSLIFMFSHDLSNPLNLVTKNWKLGLGLFLLGLLLNLIFVTTGKLYTAMGAHMGLVAVKVLFRRAPFFIFAISKKLPFWLHRDLRQSLLVHLAFVTIITIVLARLYKNK